MKNSQVIKQLLATALALASLPLRSIDNPHFWRATNFLPQFYEPRLAMPWLTSFDAFVGFGSTKTGRNGMGDKVPILDIYGSYNMQALGINVPGKNLTTAQDVVLTQLALLPAQDTFAMLSFSGKFNLIELNLCVSQNFDCGFFAQAHLPVRQLRVTDIFQTDLSSSDCASGPSKNTPAWQSFLALFPSILNKYNLSAAPTKQTGVGDLSVLIGWTNNFEDTQEIDYCDTTFRVGALFPTGAIKNQNEVFSIANGYNGHFAIPLSFDIAIGWYDWFTLGADIGAMVFFNKKHTLRMKTDCLQSGLIKLAQGVARVEPGAIWEFNAYLLADHVVCGFSLLLGYSFANKNCDTIRPENLAIFDPTIVNNDPEFFGWKMHTINILADYDLAHYDCPWLPHVGFFYNIVVGGRRIFNTNVGGFEVGINFACDF